MKDRDIPDIPKINLSLREERPTLVTVSYDVATLGLNNESLKQKMIENAEKKMEGLDYMIRLQPLIIPDIKNLKR